MIRVTRRHFAIGSTAALALPGGALAQGAYPDKLVRIAVPFSAGSMTDILARAIGERLRLKWGQSVIVENRPGLAGVSSVAKGPADGYTLMLTSNGHTVVGAVNKNAGIDPLRDFVAISKVASMPTILIAPAEASYSTLKELVALAKSKPGVLNYASAGLGSATGIAAELLKQVTATDMVMVPHTGMPEAQMSVLRADTASCFTFFNVGGDLVRSGKVKALAVTGDKRMAQLPDVPTFAEAGYPEFKYDAWFGVLAQAATPAAIVAQVNRDINAALADPELAKNFATQGVDLAGGSAEAFAAQVKDDTERFGKLLERRAG